MKPEVIDLVSDSDSEEANNTSNQAARTALQSFNPRKSKPLPHGVSRVGADGGRNDSQHNGEHRQMTGKEDKYVQSKRQEDKSARRAYGNGSEPLQTTTQKNDKAPQLPPTGNVTNTELEARSRRFSEFHAKEFARRNNNSGGHGGQAAGSASRASNMMYPLSPQSSSSRPGTSQGQGRVVRAGQSIAIVEDLTGSDDDTPAASTTAPPSKQRQVQAEIADVRPFKRQKTDGTPSSSRHVQNHVGLTRAQPQNTELHAMAQPTPRPTAGSSGETYTPEHDKLLAQLREVDNLAWDQIMPYFPGRTKGSLQTRFCTRVKGKGLSWAVAQSARQQTHPFPRPQLPQPPRTSVQAMPDLSLNVPGLASPGTARDTQRRSQQSSLPSSQLSKPPVNAQPLVGASGSSTLPSNLLNESPANAHRARFTPEEDALLARLKEVEKLSWREIAAYFPGRTEGALGVRYSTKVKKNGILPSSRPLPPPRQVPQAPSQRLTPQDEGECRRPLRQRRTGGAAAMDGFVPWSEVVNSNAFELEEVQTKQELGTTLKASSQPSMIRGRSLTSLLRHRQLGSTGRRGCAGMLKGISDDLKDSTLDGYQLQSHYESTCGDVTCLAWSADGHHFAASSIAVSDDRSMQYNSGLNLVIGDAAKGTLQELPEHHVPRPLVDARDNPNALHAMRETQDPRLFLTVTATAFSPHGLRLYSAGSDRKLRMYRVGSDVSKCRYEIDHPGSVDLLSISNDGLVATGCHSSSESIRVFDCRPTKWSMGLCLSPSSASSSLSAPPLYPSSLKWGIAYHHRNFLLAGFSNDSNDEDSAGETALWDATTGQRWDLSTATRNVFDVAWNPSPSSISTAFAVASTPSAGKRSRDTRSVVQCYAPSQNRARQVIQWECPARDINDIAYCPHDDNLIAAGATDGKVYVWDQRFASRDQDPLHILVHGDSLNVLDHDRDRELVDTGVRFLSWGATGSRLYTGSSDGVVKVWNPYSAPGDALVKDVATFSTAIMSGAFNHDFRKLLIGEECGRINLLSLGYDNEDGSAQPSTKFKLRKAPALPKDEAPTFAEARELVDTEKIVFRPMGGMPIRQAVQGPEYRGPYIKPSVDDWNRLEANLNEAVTAQHLADRQMDIDIDFQAEKERADARVKAVQEAWTQLQARHDDADKLEKAATETQKAFEEAEGQMKQLGIKYGRDKCTLGCAYLPKDDDIGGQADSRRSELRIPGALQAYAARISTDLQDLDCKDLFEAGLASKCTHCTAKTPSPRTKEHFQNMCRQRVASIKATFKGRCSSCTAPIREEQGQCESCIFACFRCSQPVKVLQNDDSVQSVLLCEGCELVWERGVLGHELVREQSRNNKGRKGKGTPDFVKTPESLSVDGEMEYHHSKWA